MPSAPSSAPGWLDPRRAALLLGALVVLVGYGLWCALAPSAAASPVGPGGPAGSFGDVDLYREIAGRVAAGGSYYTSAVQAQFAHGYPTAPFVVVRLPTLTFLQVALGEVWARILLVALAVVALLAMMVRLGDAGVHRAERLAVIVILAANLALCALGPVPWFAEAWAGVLVAIAIATRTDARWWPGVALGFAAVCFRELALPFLVVMAVLAWPRRREFVAWLGAVAGFGVLYTLHAVAVVAASRPGTTATSQGWLGLGGWPFALASVRTGSVLSTLPLWVTAGLVPLALFGWLFASGPARTILATCAAFLCCFLVVGRADNTYWGLLYAAVLLPGLALAPRGLVATVRCLTPLRS